MKKIMVIGCPGSGKSTLSKQVGQILDIPVLHLDYVYPIETFHPISKEELKMMISSFVKNHKSFVIDGNYNATMEWRLQFCDTVILLDIDTDICVKNVLQRLNENSKGGCSTSNEVQEIDEHFLDYVKGFKDYKLPIIKKRLIEWNKNIILIENYKEVECFISNLEKAITM